MQKDSPSPEEKQRRKNEEAPGEHEQIERTSSVAKEEHDKNCPQHNFIVVAAIDFGTTYSGYAYSFKNNPDLIYTNEHWVDEHNCLQTFKTPTTILFDKEEKFNSFGYDAENKYASLVKKDEEGSDDDSDDDDEDNDNNGTLGWKYFKRFKMALYRSLDERGKKSKRIDRCLTLKDNENNKMEALKVFSEAIKYLSEDFLENTKDVLEKFTLHDVHWVITVPAIWSDAAKQFMVEAANKAGIPSGQLSVALEPEAAAVYCRQMSVRKKEAKGQGADLASFEIGETFLLLDIGGGTVDITCHEILANKKLKERHRPTGGPWGGICVDDAFFELLEDLVGQNVLKKIRENKLMKNNLAKAFEIKKRSMQEDEKGFINITIHKSLLKLYKKENNKTLRTSLNSEDHKYHNKVCVTKDKLKIKKDIFLRLFEKPIEAIIGHLKEMLKLEDMEVVKTILMVGGFSECKTMRERIKAEFPEFHIICPPMADIAVLKGAVLYGHNPQIISERISARTYGLCVSIPFINGVHPSRCKYFNGETHYCSDVFKVMVNIGESVIPGETVKEHSCRPHRINDIVACIEVYESSEKNPSYTFESGCKPLGKLHINIPDTTKGKDRLIKIQFHFGFTRLIVSAVEEGTENKAEAIFDCL